MGAGFARIHDLFAGERYQVARKELWQHFLALVRRPMGFIGLAVILAFVVIATLAPVIAGPFPSYFPPLNTGAPNEPPSSHFPLGPDPTGRSNFALLVYGSRVSLIIGAVSSIIATVIGTLVGVAAGYYGKFPDK